MEYVVAFALAEDLISPFIVSLKNYIALDADGDKICLLISKVLLCAATSNIKRLKKQRYWTPRNAVLLPPFLTEAAILHGESDMVELLNIFARSITEWAKKGETAGREDDNKYAPVC